MKKTLLKSLFVLVLSLTGYVGQTHAATFYIWPNKQTFPPGVTNTVYVGMDTQGQASNAADMVLTYNPSQIEIVSVNAGGAYEGYLAPAYGSGTVRLTGYSVGSSLNGKATFASVKFKSKPGVTSATMGFMFSPGSTTDSNIAGPNSGDILTGVGSASFTFAAGEVKPAAPKEEKPKDTTAPVITISDEEMETYDGEINFTISDADSGVSFDALRVTVDGEHFTKDSDFIHIEGDAKESQVTVRPGNFEPGTEVPVMIELRDNDGNWISPPLEFSYQIPSEEEEEVAEEPVICPKLHEVAPAPCEVDYVVLLAALILFILSLAYIYYKEYKLRQN